MLQVEQEDITAEAIREAEIEETEPKETWAADIDRVKRSHGSEYFWVLRSEDDYQFESKFFENEEMAHDDLNEWAERMNIEHDYEV